MHIFDLLLRSIIQAAVMGTWGLFVLAFVAGVAVRTIVFLWRKFHPVRAIKPLKGDVVDAEWVREAQ